MNIGENIKRMREARNMSQKELAKLVEVGQPMVAQIERGSRIPTMALGASIAKVFGCSMDTLWGENQSD